MWRGRDGRGVAKGFHDYTLGDITDENYILGDMTDENYTLGDMTDEKVI